MNEEKLKKIVDEIIDDDDQCLNILVYNTVKKILDLPENTEISITELMDSESNSNVNYMFKINRFVTEVCKKINITLDKSKYKGKFVGLPFNIPFVKKTVTDEIINSIPKQLEKYIYIHNGNIYIKQKLPIELENDYNNFKIKFNQPRCKNCGELLSFLMPDGTNLYCNKCDKCYINNNGKAGDEISFPYEDKNVFY